MVSSHVCSKKADKMIEQIFSKYQTMGREIDKVYVEITKYQDEMKKSIGTLDGLYEQNLKYYLDLEKYVVAGEMLLERLNTELVPMYEERVRNNDQLAGIELESLKNSVEILEQRIDDLEKARMVALLTAPQIRMIQRGNNKLIGKINTAFITTIPIFKKWYHSSGKCEASKSLLQIPWLNWIAVQMNYLRKMHKISQRKVWK